MLSEERTPFPFLSLALGFSGASGILPYLPSGHLKEQLYSPSD